MYGGLISTIVLIVFSPGCRCKTAMLPKPGLRLVPLAKPRHRVDPAGLHPGHPCTVVSDDEDPEIAAEMEVRSLTGIGAEKAVRALIAAKPELFDNARKPSTLGERRLNAQIGSCSAAVAQRP